VSHDVYIHLDEMNVHVPQTLEAKAEFQEILSITQNSISGSSRPMYGIVQDALSGAYMMTNGWIGIPHQNFNDMMCTLDLTTAEICERIERVRQSYSRHFENPDEKLYTGRGLISTILPEHFSYAIHNKTMPNEPNLIITGATILEGALNKSALGAKAGSIHHYIAREHSNSEAIKFLSRARNLANAWIQLNGFSAGMIDCIPNFTGTGNNLDRLPQVDESITKAFIKAKIAEETYENPDIREAKVNSALNAAKDIGLKLAKEALSKSNRFSVMQVGGAKGSDVNTAQITGLLGQQNISGRRVEKLMNRGRRVLPHYPEKFDLENPEELEKYYESRGFIHHSYYSGLNPQEFWHQAAAGREGITDTACKTASAGYIQRRIARMLEDLVVQYDGTIRNSTGKIIQFCYGGDNLDGSKIMKVDGVFQPMNISHIIGDLNDKYEFRNRLGDKFRDLSIETIIDTVDDTCDLSPIGSQNSGGSVASVLSPISQGSRDDDYDD